MYEMAPPTKHPMIGNSIHKADVITALPPAQIDDIEPFNVPGQLGVPLSC